MCLFVGLVGADAPRLVLGRTCHQPVIQRRKALRGSDVIPVAVVELTTDPVRFHGRAE